MKIIPPKGEVVTSYTNSFYFIDEWVRLTAKTHTFSNGITVFAN